MTGDRAGAAGAGAPVAGADADAALFALIAQWRRVDGAVTRLERDVDRAWAPLEADGLSRDGPRMACGPDRCAHPPPPQRWWWWSEAEIRAGLARAVATFGSQRKYRAEVERQLWRFRAIGDAWAARFVAAGLEPLERAAREAWDEWNMLAERIAATPAASVAGVRERLRLAVALACANADGPPFPVAELDTPVQLAAAALRDLDALTGGGDTVAGAVAGAVAAA